MLGDVQTQPLIYPTLWLLVLRDARGVTARARSKEERGGTSFFTYGTASADALSASDPSMTREAQGGRRHGVSGDRAVPRDHTAL